MTTPITEKIINALRASYGADTDAEWLVDTARELRARKAVAFDADTNRLEISDPVVVRELAIKLLTPAPRSPLVAPKWEQPHADATFDEKLEAAARNMAAFGVAPTINSETGSSQLGFTAADVLAYTDANRDRHAAEIANVVDHTQTHRRTT